MADFGAQDFARRRNNDQLLVAAHDGHPHNALRFVVDLVADHSLAGAALGGVLGFGRALAEAARGDGQDFGLFGAQQIALRAEPLEADQRLAIGYDDAAHAAADPRGLAQRINGEPDRLARAGHHQHIVAGAGERGFDQLVAVGQVERDQPAAAHVGEGGERRLLDLPAARAEDDVIVGEIGDGDDRCDPLIGLQIEQIAHRQAAPLARALVHLVRLEAEDAALIGEEQQLVVGVAGDHPRGRFGVLRAVGVVAALGDALDAHTAAPLRAESVDRLPLDVAVPRERHHRRLVRHQISLAELLHAARNDLRLALRAVGFDQLVEVVDDHAVDLLGVRQQAFEVLDRFGQIAVFLFEPGALQRGQAAQLHVEHRLRLPLGEVEGVVLQAVARGVGRFRRANRGDDLVDHVDRLEQTLDDVMPIARLLEVELGAPGDDLAAVINERRNQLDQRERARAPARERYEIGVVANLQIGRAVQMRQHRPDVRVAAQLDHEPHAVAIRLIAQVADAVDLLVAHMLRNLLDDPHLVGLVGNFGEDDLHAVAGGFLNVLPSAQGEAAPPPRVGVLQVLVVLAREEDARRGEIGPFEHGHQVADRGVGALDHHLHRRRRLAQVVRRHLAGHRHRDPRRPVDQQIRQPPRQYRRFVQRLIEVGREIDGVFVDVRQHFFADRAEPRLGVTHCRRRVVINRTVVALPVDQRGAHVPRLRHPHHRFVDRHIGVRVVLAQHLADNPRALAVGLIGAHAQIVHRVENPPLHRLEAVAHIGQRARYDHAHRVIEIRRLHLVDKLLRADVVRRGLARFSYHITLQPDRGISPLSASEQIIRPAAFPLASAPIGVTLSTESQHSGFQPAGTGFGALRASRSAVGVAAMRAIARASAAPSPASSQTVPPPSLRLPRSTESNHQA